LPAPNEDEAILVLMAFANATKSSAVSYTEDALRYAVYLSNATFPIAPAGQSHRPDRRSGRARISKIASSDGSGRVSEVQKRVKVHHAPHGKRDRRARIRESAFYSEEERKEKETLRGLAPIVTSWMTPPPASSAVRILKKWFPRWIRRRRHLHQGRRAAEAAAASNRNFTSV